MIKVVLFDLDGTLLPMDQNVFTKAYFGGLAAKLAPLGYEPRSLVAAIWAGSEAMVRNDGSQTNEEVFWSSFCGAIGKNARADEPSFAEYYEKDFDSVKNACGYDPRAEKTVRAIKSLGYRVALATNPLFPSIATKKRTEWTGLSVEDFELVTTYENSRFCKPNLDYYREITEKLGVLPEECLMVGNDVDEDMIAERLQMKVFLLTDCLLNKSGADIEKYQKGSFDELLLYIQNISK